MSGYALSLRISFFEAHFKVHHTKAFRLTYPIPLPTSVAGIFGALLGIERHNVSERFNDYSFGACISRHRAIESVEEATFVQHAKNRMGVVKTHILNSPEYFVVISHETRDSLERIASRIREGIEYLPYGGQNDFFPKDWKVDDKLKETKFSTRVDNYLPADLTHKINKGASLEVLPVAHRLGPKQEFYFILEGSLTSKQKLPVCLVGDKNIALFRLLDFAMGEWDN